MTPMVQPVNGVTPQPPAPKRKRDDGPPAKQRSTLYMKEDHKRTGQELPAKREDYCKNAACVTANKQHTHTGANCGYKLRSAPGYDSARAAARTAARPGGFRPTCALEQRGQAISVRRTLQRRVREVRHLQTGQNSGPQPSHIDHQPGCTQMVPNGGILRVTTNLQIGVGLYV
jgi:hypothetical protein